MPASQQELHNTKEEIKQLLENNARLMQEYAQNNIRKNHEETKKELEAKISTTVAACCQKSNAIQQALHNTRSTIIQEMEKKHRIRMRTLKQGLFSYYGEFHLDSEKLKETLTNAHENHRIAIQQKCSAIVDLLNNLQKNVTQKIKTTQQTLQKTAGKHSVLVSNFHEERKNKVIQTTELYLKTVEKIKSLEKLCCMFQEIALQQKQKNVTATQQIFAFTMNQKNSSHSSIKQAFGKHSSILNTPKANSGQ